MLQLFDILERLIAFDTESSKSNFAIIAYIAKILTAQHVPFVIVPDPMGQKASLFATIGPQVDGGVLLSGHTDVVPVTGQVWTSDPFQMRREAGRLYGRGACDMKGFVAACLAMVPKFLTIPLQKPIHLLFTYDEETTCLGPVASIARFGKDFPRPAFVIVGEPTLMQVADAHKSVATYHTHVRGVEGHSAKPHLGVNAVEIASVLVQGLYEIGQTFRTEFPQSHRFDPAFSTIHVGTIMGGTARNILARDCAFSWEFRGLPHIPASTARSKFDALAARVSAERLENFADACITTVTEVEVPGLAPEISSPAATLGLRLTQSNQTCAVAFATEAGRFQEAGLSTIVCGPGSIHQAHQPDEWIAEEQLIASTEFLWRLGQSLSA